MCSLLSQHYPRHKTNVFSRRHEGILRVGKLCVTRTHMHGGALTHRNTISIHLVNSYFLFPFIFSICLII